MIMLWFLFERQVNGSKFIMTMTNIMPSYLWGNKGETFEWPRSWLGMKGSVHYPIMRYNKQGDFYYNTQESIINYSKNVFKIRTVATCGRWCGGGAGDCGSCRVASRHNTVDFTTARTVVKDARFLKHQLGFLINTKFDDSLKIVKM